MVSIGKKHEFYKIDHLFVDSKQGSKERSSFEVVGAWVGVVS